MNKIYQKSFSGEKNAGFTLIELLVVVLIIGILSAVALPQYKLAVARSRIAALLPAVRNVYDQKKLYYMSNGRYPGALELESIPTGFRVIKGDNSYLYGTSARYMSMWVPSNSDTVIGLLEGGTVGVSHSGFCMARPASEWAQRVCRSFSGRSEPNSPSGEWLYYSPRAR